MTPPEALQILENLRLNVTSLAPGPLSGKDHDILREAVQTLRGMLVSKETEDKLSRIAGNDTKLAGGETPLTGPAK